MNRNWLLIVIVILLLVAAVVVLGPRMSNNVTPIAEDHTAAHSAPAAQMTDAKVMPAHFEEAPPRSSLGPTLAPEKFEGQTRDAYKAAREIPVTLAQMPCYCHCDRGFGHKSLYSCFQDDHASHCAVCVSEALLTLKLEKEGKTPAQIRDQIVQTFGN